MFLFAAQKARVFKVPRELDIDNKRARFSKTDAAYDSAKFLNFQRESFTDLTMNSLVLFIDQSQVSPR